LGSCLRAHLLLDLVSGDECSLLADSVRILAVLFALQLPFGGCCCYQTIVWVGLKSILRVMPTCVFFWGIRVGLKGLETVMLLSKPSILVFLSLYVAPIKMTRSFFDQFSNDCLYLLRCYLCFEFIVGELIALFRSFTFSSFRLKSKPM
jgi:hypothetical protein